MSLRQMKKNYMLNFFEGTLFFYIFGQLGRSQLEDPIFHRLTLNHPSVDTKIVFLFHSPKNPSNEKGF